jgi:hypothetical protein
MRTKLTRALLTLAGLAFLASYFGGQTSRAAALLDDGVNPHWKGASQLTPVAVAPNPARCGPFPENIEITFTGSGIDTGGGIFTSAASTCTNTTTGLIFDLKSSDTYVTGDAVFVEWDRRKGRRLRSRTIPLRKQSHAVQWPERTGARLVCG